MENETRGVLVSIFESCHAHANLSVRRTAAFPPQVAATIHAVHRRAPSVGLAGSGLGYHGCPTTSAGTAHAGNLSLAAGRRRQSSEFGPTRRPCPAEGLDMHEHIPD